jgi:hypothetical protein
LTIESELEDKIRENFYHNLLDGHFHKDLVRVILEMSGYEVYPYGYESFLTPIKIKFEKKKIKHTEISRKIRCTPDLLVYDPDSQILNLVEVKSRRWDWTNDVAIDSLHVYKNYWQGSILVMVLPAGHFFYAQNVDKLSERKDDVFDLNKEFDWFENIFEKVELDTLHSYKQQIINFWYRNPNIYDHKSSPVPRFNLLNLIQELQTCDFDYIFHEQNKRNLISRKAFANLIKELTNEGKIKLVGKEVSFLHL